MSCDSVIITEIYASVQGESTFAGLPCTFVRLTGCPLRCRWCDTVYGFSGGQRLQLAEVIDRVDELGIGLVELTGGEPLAQEGCLPLAQSLIAEGYQVMMETGGSESVKDVPERVHIVMDLKCPGSGMVDRNHWANLDYLKRTDEIKFVIADRGDFDWAVSTTKKHGLDHQHHVLFSPAFGLLQPATLVQWLLDSGLSRVRLNLQQHKYIWSPRAKGV